MLFTKLFLQLIKSRRFSVVLFKLHLGILYSIAFQHKKIFKEVSLVSFTEAMTN